MEIVKMKDLQNTRISSLKFQVEKLKLILKKYKKNLEKGGIEQAIILEEGKSYIETVEDINKNEKIDKEVENLKDEINKNLDINDFGKILKLNVNNMNINVSINLNKQYINNQLSSDSGEIKEISIQTDNENNNFICDKRLIMNDSI